MLDARIKKDAVCRRGACLPIHPERPVLSPHGPLLKDPTSSRPGCLTRSGVSEAAPTSETQMPYHYSGVRISNVGVTARVVAYSRRAVNLNYPATIWGRIGRLALSYWPP